MCMCGGCEGICVCGCKGGKAFQTIVLEDSGFHLPPWVQDGMVLSLLDWHLGPRTVFIPSFSSSRNFSLKSSAPTGDSSSCAGQASRSHGGLALF